MVVLGHLNMVFKALEMGFRPCEKPFYVLIHIVQCFGVPTKSLGVYQSSPSLSIPEFPFFSSLLHGSAKKPMFSFLAYSSSLLQSYFE